MKEAGKTSKIAPKRILVVDDEPHVADMVRMVLKLAGHEVEIAENAERALSMYEPGKFDLVFTDYSMGGMDGLEMAKRMRQACPTQPIIMITAYAQSITNQRDRLVNINSLLEKPFLIQDVHSAMAKIFAPPEPAE